MPSLLLILNKVADFGLSRILRDAYYVSQKKKPMPLRWMPLEAIYFNKFSSQSDIWSFGILVWFVGRSRL
jgi:receptor tyrosine kinase